MILILTQDHSNTQLFPRYQHITSLYIYYSIFLCDLKTLFLYFSFDDVFNINFTECADEVLRSANIKAPVLTIGTHKVMLWLLYIAHCYIMTLWQVCCHQTSSLGNKHPSGKHHCMFFWYQSIIIYCPDMSFMFFVAYHIVMYIAYLDSYVQKFYVISNDNVDCLSYLFFCCPNVTAYCNAQVSNPNAHQSVLLQNS